MLLMMAASAVILRHDAAQRASVFDMLRQRCYACARDGKISGVGAYADDARLLR